MRISDWSSDLCSSDLIGAGERIVRDIAVGIDGKKLQFRAGRVDDIAIGRRSERPVARIGDRLGRRIALHDEQALADDRSEEHTSELQSLMRISYAVFCLKKKTNNNKNT